MPPPESRADRLAHRINARGNHPRRGIAPVLVLELVGGETLVANHHAMRHADQVGVGEHCAGPRTTIVKQHFDAGSGEFRVELLGCGLRRGRFVGIDRADDHAKRRDRVGPDDAVGVVALLDDGGSDARLNFMRSRWKGAGSGC